MLFLLQVVKLERLVNLDHSLIWKSETLKTINRFWEYLSECKDCRSTVGEACIYEPSSLPSSIPMPKAMSLYSASSLKVMWPCVLCHVTYFDQWAVSRCLTSRGVEGLEQWDFSFAPLPLPWGHAWIDQVEWEMCGIVVLAGTNPPEF